MFQEKFKKEDRLEISLQLYGKSKDCEINTGVMEVESLINQGSLCERATENAHLIYIGDTIKINDV